jgi:hypothetical protein
MSVSLKLGSSVNKMIRGKVFHFGWPGTRCPLDFPKIIDLKAMGFTIRVLILVPKGFQNAMRLVLDEQKVT